MAKKKEAPTNLVFDNLPPPPKGEQHTAKGIAKIRKETKNAKDT